MSKNDTAWQKLFAKYDIVNQVNKNGLFEIKAEQINEFRESRLMTKFDHISNLPQLFSQNNLAILPVTRGSYVIGQFDAYYKMKPFAGASTEIIPFPTHLESIDYSNIYSESAALNCAFVTNILKDVAGEDVLPTVSGRMSTSSFNFNINAPSSPKQISVNNSQCEIDGGYEGENVLLLVEAKNYKIDDFLIRQLYYPYRLWQGKIRKQTIPVFLTYSNDTFTFSKYRFDDINDYNSIEIYEQKNYIITSHTISKADIVKVLNTVPIAPEPQISFPQADSFARVVDLMGLIYNSENGFLDGEFITDNYDFDTRQTNYYSTAGRYLGLIVNDGPARFKLTDKGRAIMAMSYYNKNMALVSTILSFNVFNQAMRLYLQQLSPLSKDQVVAIMKGASLYNIDSDKTYHRRASTVIRWLEWILDLEE